MAILYTNSASIKKGIDYIGLAKYGNAFQLTDETRVSINHTPFAQFPKYTTIFIHPEFLYTFENDTVVLVANEIVPDFGVVTNAYNTNDIPLGANVESTAVVSLTDREGRETTKGQLSALIDVESGSNQDQEVIIRLRGDTLGVISTSNPIIVKSNTLSTECLHSINLDGLTIPGTEVLAFTVEGTSGDLTIKGSNIPSQLKLERRNL